MTSKGKYLAGLQPQKQLHRELVAASPEAEFATAPLTRARGGDQYFGLPCRVPFTYAGQTVTHQGLVVLSGPMRRAVRRSRAAAFRDLRGELAVVRAKSGQKRYRSVKDAQARAETGRRHSAVGTLMCVEAYATASGTELRWWSDRTALAQAMRLDGRYLLVTNDRTLTSAQLLELYRAKDGQEKDFEVAKQALRVRPLYVHSDERIEALLLINLMALLVDSALERPVRSHGLVLTTRRLIEQRESLTLIATHCWDGSVLGRVTPVNVEQAELLQALAEILAEITVPRLPMSPWTRPVPRREALSPPVMHVAVAVG